MPIITDLLIFAVPLLLVVGVAISARRALTLFVVEIRDRQVVCARGRIPQSLLNDFLVVSPQGQEARLVIRCRVEQGGAKLLVSGAFSDDTVQQLRNLIGLWPLARLRAAPRYRA